MKKFLLFFVATQFSLTVHAGVASIQAVIDRAKMFESLHLYPLAREQYKYLLTLDSHNKEAKKNLDDLIAKESQLYRLEAQHAFDNNNMEAARQSILMALEVNPTNSAILSLKQRIDESLKIKTGLSHRINKEYQAGLSDYGNKNWDKALEHFVRVINMDPTHEGSLTHIEKIGEQLNLSRRSIE